MAIYRLVLPRMGESVNEATLTAWNKEVGDRIEEDEAVVEIATDKVDSDVPSPVNGVLKEKLCGEGDVVQVGEALALIEIEDEDVETDISEQEQLSVPSASDTAEKEEEENIDLENIPGITSLNKEETVSSSHSSYRFYSPLVRSIAEQEGISEEELQAIKGSGAEGRLTKHDLLGYIENRGERRQGKSAPQAEKTAIGKTQSISKPIVASATGDEIIEMDRMRKLIADHMVQSVHTSPHVSSFVEADVTNLVNWRNSIKDKFKKREGENITFTPIFIEAISKAIRDFPMINVSVDGYNIIKRKNINIGMAAALPSGNLIVPVIKNADQLNLVGLAKAVNDLAKRARENRLNPDDTQGGTFTFTNIGAFGNIMGVPIINQPQAAILAVGTIKKKPAVVETEFGDAIAIRHMMYLSLSYDHRVIDGALGGTFLKRVADYLENWNMEREV